jgi:acetyl esterase/lipase
MESKEDPIFKSANRAAGSVNKELKPDEASPLFSPLLHPNLRGLPPAFFQVAGLDPLRDEALIYEKVLREENGVDTRINIYDGLGHMFWTNW